MGDERLQRRLFGLPTGEKAMSGIDLPNHPDPQEKKGIDFIGGWHGDSSNSEITDNNGTMIIKLNTDHVTGIGWEARKEVVRRLVAMSHLCAGVTTDLLLAQYTATPRTFHVNVIRNVSLLAIKSLQDQRVQRGKMETLVKNLSEYEKKCEILQKELEKSRSELIVARAALVNAVSMESSLRSIQ